jgi:hypothetical protein
MRLDLWLKGTLRTPDGGAAPAGAAIEALVTDCRNRQTCPVGSTWTDASGGFELRTDAELDAQMGRMPGESSALFVQARLDGALLATATVCWIEDLPAGRAVEVDLMAAKAIRVLALPMAVSVPPRSPPTAPALAAISYPTVVAAPNRNLAYTPTVAPRPQPAISQRTSGASQPRNVLAEFLGPVHALSRQEL